MKDQIVINVPYPVRIFGLTFLIKRKIGFLFTNLSVHQFRENNGLKTNAELKKWSEENTETRLILEMLYASAQSYCMMNTVKQNFTKSLFSVAISNAKESDLTKVYELWKKSETFGAKFEKKKNRTK